MPLTLLGSALALLVGLSLGLLGGGGSILAVPVLIYALDYPVKTAIPMSLVVVGLTSLMGAAQQARSGKVHWRAAGAFGPPAVVGALGGAQLGLLVSDQLQLTIFAVLLIAGSVAMWFGPTAWSAAGSAGAPAAPRPLGAIGLLGALVGVLTGLVGVGGGFLYVPVLVLLAGLEMKQAVGTSLTLIVLSSAAGFVRYAGTLSLDWVAILQFTLAAIAGVLIGSRLGGRLPQQVLRRGFAVFLLVLGGVVLLFGRGGSPPMIFRRFYDDTLAQASYLIGCAATGEALVVDPNRLVDQYVAAAEADGVRITGVTETHIHADYLSGTRELAARTGAGMFLSACGPPEWRYAFAGDPGVTLLRDGDLIRVGNILVQAVHTPGHTPEHLMFLVTDGAVASEPMGACTGDFVFVGDVGRPDLLEKAAHVAGASEGAARDLWRSLEQFRQRPDHLQIWPGHGAGSACGKGLSAVPQSTLGYERRYNWAFGAADETEFVRTVLAGQPEPPRYFGVMKRLNREGPALLGRLPAPERVAESRLAALLAEGAVVVDTRLAYAFAAGHVGGTLSIPLTKSFTTWAGSLLPYDRDLYLVLADAGAASVAAAIRNLVLIGLDRVVGYFGPEAIDLWAAEGRPVETMPQVTPAELATRADGPLVVDVRAASEWDAGHLPGALHIPLPDLEARMAEVPRDRDVVLQCQGGGRSAIATSLLQASGYTRVANLTGGFGAWRAAGLPVMRDRAKDGDGG